MKSSTADAGTRGVISAPLAPVKRSQKKFGSPSTELLDSRVYFLLHDTYILQVIQMWCPTQIIVNGENHDFPLPTAPLETNYPNSQGMTYEIQSVRECLLKGYVVHYL